MVKGQLLATLDPTAAQLTVEQAQSNLTSAEDNLTNAEDQTATSGSSASTSLENAPESTEFVTFHPAVTDHDADDHDVDDDPHDPDADDDDSDHHDRNADDHDTTPTRTTSSGSAARAPAGSSSAGSSGSSGAVRDQAAPGRAAPGRASGQTSTTSAETIAANIASAQAAVDGAEATLRNAENALHETHLYAPATGTVVNVESVSPGDAVSGGAIGLRLELQLRARGRAGVVGLGLGLDRGQPGRLEQQLVLVVEQLGPGRDRQHGLDDDDRRLQRVRHLQDQGRPARQRHARGPLRRRARRPRELHLDAGDDAAAASSAMTRRSRSISATPGSNPGMSASAAVITGQASGVNLPNSAVTTTGSVGHVNLLQNGKAVSTTVVVGLVGDSRTQIVSGLKRRRPGPGHHDAARAGLRLLAVVVGLQRDARRRGRPGWRRRAVPGRRRWVRRRRRLRGGGGGGAAAAADGTAPARHRP